MCKTKTKTNHIGARCTVYRMVSMAYIAVLGNRLAFKLENKFQKISVNETIIYCRAWFLAIGFFLVFWKETFKMPMNICKLLSCTLHRIKCFPLSALWFEQSGIRFGFGWNCFRWLNHFTIHSLMFFLFIFKMSQFKPKRLWPINGFSKVIVFWAEFQNNFTF